MPWFTPPKPALNQLVLPIQRLPPMGLKKTGGKVLKVVKKKKKGKKKINK